MIPNFTRFATLHCGDAVTYHYDNKDRVHIFFVNTGYLTHTSARRIRATSPPRIKDPYAPLVFGVGFDGVGPHGTYNQRRETRTHGVWRAMLRRCYGDEYRPAYDGCTVCEEWHNFQNFAAWYEAAGGCAGMELDKDIKEAGNKEYHPSKCAIVTKVENLAARVLTQEAPLGMRGEPALPHTTEGSHRAGGGVGL